jgi:hypothetical protein
MLNKKIYRGIKYERKWRKKRLWSNLEFAKNRFSNERKFARK